MEHDFDINYYYMTEYVCSDCGNICSRNDTVCPSCGKQHIEKTDVCRSCLDYTICLNNDCGFVSHKEVTACPICGSQIRRCCSLIPEDHWGIPIPSPSRCNGSLRDNDEGIEQAKYLAMCVKSKNA